MTGKKSDIKEGVVGVRAGGIMTGQKVAILGFGVEGKAAYEYWNGQGAEITICDAKTDLKLPGGVKSNLGPDYLQDLGSYDLVVRSPGVPFYQVKTSVPITSVTREFMAKCPAQIIGVTGTKGKGTTATLIAKILEADGHKVWLGGNIGTPALDFLASVQPTDYVVLELSSFQLEDVTQSPRVGVCLMIAPDHLDHHRHMEEYIQAKGNIFRYQTKQDVAVYHGGQPETVRLGQLSVGNHIPYCTPGGAYIRDEQVWFRDQSICPVASVGLLGRHNLENVCAAVSVTYGLVRSKESVARMVAEFKGLPHRLEEVGEINGVRFINDSFAANPVSAVAALKALSGPKVVILGGFDRHIDQSELIQTVKHENVRQVVLVGQTAKNLAALLKSENFSNYEMGGKTMAEIVEAASNQAKPGDTVLLSPGSPSFDMFQNFSDRGNKFRDAVKLLERQPGEYNTFIFEGYGFDPDIKQLELKYSFDGLVQFVETFSFDFEFAPDYDQAALERACFGLFMMAGVSYYKAGLPSEIKIRQGRLSQSQADFFQKTYRLGLGEFCYRNNLPLVKLMLPVSLEVEEVSDINGLYGSLVPVGGGKDSLVTIELLREAGEDMVTWMVNHNDQVEPLIAKTALPHMSVTRQVAPELIRLNQQGALNGHVPISAILNFAGVISAILSGRASLVLSNEWSAGEGNTEYEGVMVNHQYSKSFEFEQDFQEYVKSSISPSIDVFSLLRPLSELKIAETFCTKHFDKYAEVFSSCNRNFHLEDHAALYWCGECPKCAFVFLIFSPFLSKQALVGLFEGKNLFASEELEPTFDELLGLSGHKPFECVGEIKECRQALLMAKAKGEYPELARYSFPDPEFDYKEKHSNNIPDQFKSLIDKL